MKSSTRLLTIMSVALLSLAACGDDSDKPYVKIVGGGFVFNYRLAEAYYGFVVRPERTLPDGAVLEAQFEDPAGGKPITLRHEVTPGRASYAFETPAVHGVRANQPYKSEVRLVGADGKVLGRYEKTFTSRIAQKVLGEKPLTVGPGYTRNPERTEGRTPPPK